MKNRESFCNVKKCRAGDVELFLRHLKAGKKLLSGGGQRGPTCCEWRGRLYSPVVCRQAICKNLKLPIELPEPSHRTGTHYCVANLPITTLTLRLFLLLHLHSSFLFNFSHHILYYRECTYCDRKKIEF